MPCPFGAYGDGHSSVVCPIIDPFLKTDPVKLRVIFTECRTSGRPFGAYRGCRVGEALAYLWGLPGHPCRWRRCCWKVIDSLGAMVFALRADRAFGSGTEENWKKELLTRCILMLGLLALSLLCGTAFAKTGGDTTIWFDTGGSVEDDYGTVVQSGAKAAAADMECELCSLYSDWNPETVIMHFHNAVAARPDGIVVMGHPDDVALGPLVDATVKQGIVVASIGTALPETQARHRIKGSGYVEMNNYTQGKALVEGVLRCTNLKEDDRAFIWDLECIPDYG